VGIGAYQRPERIPSLRFAPQFAALQQLAAQRPADTVSAPAAPPFSTKGTAGPGEPGSGARRPPSSLMAVGGAFDGMELGGYKLQKRIGSGGFGEVWRAEAPGGIEVAVKIIFRPLDHSEVLRELGSLELIKKLRHPFLLQTQAF